VTGYIVSRDGIEAGTTATTTYAETGLSPGVTYSYSVAARDAAGIAHTLRQMRNST